MTDDLIIKKRYEQKEIKLREKRREILSLEPEKALEAILNAPLPAELIQSFPEQDLFFLVHDIGVTDAIPILALATSEQWGYMLDVEIWNRDRMDIDAVTRWFQILLLGDGKRLVNWLLVERLEFLELYLFKNIHVIIREENQDPAEIPQDYFTVDDYVYVKVKDKPAMPEGLEGVVTQAELEEVIQDLINKIIDINHYLYQSIMLESMSVIPAETEEEDFRIRNIRLAEKGFLPFDESIGVFSPMSPEQIVNEKITRKSFDNSETLLPAPVYHMKQIKEENLFTFALAKIGDLVDMADLELEFASLCNQVISAEQKTIRGRETLGVIVKRVSSGVSLGIEILGGKEMKNDSDKCVNLVMNHSFKNLFRVGYGKILELRFKAMKITREGWFHRNMLPLGFWGEHILGVTGGLLVKKPVFFDNYKTGRDMYRDFRTLEDVDVTERALDEMKSFDDLFSLMNPDLTRFKDRFLTYAGLMMTLWFHKKNGGLEADEGPVAMNDFRVCFADMWEPIDPGHPDAGRKISDREKSGILAWLSDRTGFTEDEISTRLGYALESLLTDIDKEYGTVSDKDLDPRFISHFCIAS